MATDLQWRWYAGDDAGTSSKTIWRIMTGETLARDWPGTPHDVYDFGRCVRLIDLFSEWHERLPEVAAAHPSWTPFVERWDELVSKFRDDSTWMGECNKAILMICDPSGRTVEAMMKPYPAIAETAEGGDEDDECTCRECPVHW